MPFGVKGIYVSDDKRSGGGSQPVSTSPVGVWPAADARAPSGARARVAVVGLGAGSDLSNSGSISPSLISDSSPSHGVGFGGLDWLSLGNHANLRAAPSKPGSFYARQRRYQLQSVARLALPRERVRHCLRHVINRQKGVDLLHDPEHGRGHFKGLQTCGLAWVCPVCAAKIGERRRCEVEQGIAAACDRGWSVLLLTFTFSHGPLDALSGSLRRFLDAQGDMCRSRAYRALMALYGAVGTIKALECSVGSNGWHPHRHVLLILDAPLSALEVVALEAAVYALWSAAAGKSGLGMDRRHGLTVQSTWGAVGDYVAKWGIAAELTKPKMGRGAHLSPFQLLGLAADTGEAAAVSLFREYAEVFKESSQLRWSRGLRDMLGVGPEKSDAELAEEETMGSVLLANLDLDHWRAVIHFDRAEHTRARLNTFMDAGDLIGLLDYVGLLLIRYKSYEKGGG